LGIEVIDQVDVRGNINELENKDQNPQRTTSVISTIRETVRPFRYPRHDFTEGVLCVNGGTFSSGLVYGRRKNSYAQGGERNHWQVTLSVPQYTPANVPFKCPWFNSIM